MKKWYILLLIVPLLSKAQVPAFDPRSFENKSQQVSQQEEQSFRRRLQVQQSNSLSGSVASNNFDVNYYRCQWQVDPSVRYINGNITSYFTITSATDNIIFDLDSLFIVDSILYHGNKIGFQQILSDGLKIQLPSSLSAGVKDSLSIFYQGVPDSLKTKVIYQGFYRGNFAFWTLSEPYGAKDWWPCKNGLTDKADSLDVIITIPDIYIASSNGILAGEWSAGGKKTSFFKHRYPIATYLVALAVTNYAITKDSVLLNNRQMPVLMYSFTFDVDYYKPATAEVKKCLQKFSELFGVYPFYKEQYCQTQFGALGGGMEHQTNSFIIDRWENLVAHELGHQWFGDKVTCGSWQDIWLNEGFASYTEDIYYEFFDPAMFIPVMAYVRDQITKFPDGSVWVPDTTSIPRIFSNRLTYYKGSFVVHMLRWVLGDAVFFSGIREYLDDPAVKYGFARTADLQRVLERVSGKNLGNFFTKWVYGEGFPSYQLTWSQNVNNWAHIKLGQTTSHPSVSFYDMPVALQFKNQSRDTTIVVDHKFSGQEFWLNVGFKADSVIIDPKVWLLANKNTVTKEVAEQTANLLGIYPNPAPDRVFISLKNPTDKKLSMILYNSIGQLVYSKEVNLSGHDELLNIPVARFPHGVYWLTLKGEKDVKLVRKIIR